MRTTRQIKVSATRPRLLRAIADLERENAELRKRVELWERRYYERYHTGADFITRLHDLLQARADRIRTLEQMVRGLECP